MRDSREHQRRPRARVPARVSHRVFLSSRRERRAERARVARERAFRESTPRARPARVVDETEPDAARGDARSRERRARASREVAGRATRDAREGRHRGRAVGPRPRVWVTREVVVGISGISDSAARG